MKRISVFCGSSFGNKNIYKSQAKLLGQRLAKEKIELVYGGANVGLMGALADGALMENGIVIGVLPIFLNSKEIAHKGLTEMILVDSLHERKTKMNKLSDGAIALPGGFGTLEELFEMVTWGQLGLHVKPIGILNIDGFYDHLTDHLQKMVDQGFLKEIHRNMVLIGEDIEELLSKMKRYRAPQVEKWISQETT